MNSWQDGSPTGWISMHRVTTTTHDNNVLGDRISAIFV